MSQASQDAPVAIASSKPGPADSTRQSHRRLRALVIRLVELGVSLVATAGLLEIVALLIVGEQPKFPRHVVGAPWGLRYNEPGARYRHKSADGTWYFRINSQGMRADRDYSYPKPPGVRRIIALGDSMTAGLEVANEQTFCRVLERELGKAGLKVEVFNTGVSGFSSAEECLYLERELIKYDPDIVIVSYCGNDLDDNVRTGLFRLEDHRLIEWRKTYVPAGRLGNFLNTNWFFNFLSERSNAFCLIKERLTLLLKNSMVKQNATNLVDAPEGRVTDAQELGRANVAGSKERQLFAAIYERMYQGLRAKGIPLVVHSIPNAVVDPQKQQFIDSFPRELFDLNRPGLDYLSGKSILEPSLGKQLLFWTHSHFHLTPFSHEMIGKALAEVILRNGWLSSSP
jgi:hypothetical protein